MSTTLELRLAGPSDAPATAALHASGIAEGFLPRLGPRVLRLLHRRITLEPSSFMFIASSGGTMAGFIAGTTDVGRLYRSFVQRDAWRAAILAAPRAPALWRRALETLRYPGRAAGEWPRAELLAVAVREGVRGQGVGAGLTRAFQDELGRRGIPAAKVVVGAGNSAAMALYSTTGFRKVATIDVHHGHSSDVLVWP